MQNLKCLYYFTSDEISVIEIKRTELPEDAPLSEIYKWLIVSKNKKIFELDFVSMGKSGDEESRVFVESDFKFNQFQGNFKILGKSFLLICNNPNELPSEELSLIQSYLSYESPKDMPCSFRPLKSSDVNFFKKCLVDQEVIRYSMTKFHRINNESQIVDWFYSTLFDPNTFQLGLVDPISKQLIGYAGIASLNDIDRNGEYFIFIGDKSYWGKGIASFVTKEIVRKGFQQLNLHRIFLTASSSNPGAIRAYEKAGFVHEGRMRESFYRNNEYSDKIFMGLLKTDHLES